MNKPTKSQLFYQTFKKSQVFNYKRLVEFKYASDAPPFLGFIVSTKYGNAVLRNRLKRMSRALYVLFFNKTNTSIIIKPLTSNIKYSTLHDSFFKLKREVVN